MEPKDKIIFANGTDKIRVWKKKLNLPCPKAKYIKVFKKRKKESDE